MRELFFLFISASNETIEKGKGSVDLACKVKNKQNTQLSCRDVPTTEYDLFFLFTENDGNENNTNECHSFLLTVG